MMQPSLATSTRKPFATYSLVALNALVFVWELSSGVDFNSNQSLFDHGALYGPAVTHGQWSRIVSAGFLHAGFAHVALNMVALLQLGSFVEMLLGRWRMLLIYAVALIGGGFAIVLFAPYDVTVGASGAIFGLFGAIIAVGLRLGSRGRSLIMTTAPVLVLNLVFTFAVPFISKAGHLGGLISGFVIGLVLSATMRFASPPVDEDTGRATPVSTDAGIPDDLTPREQT